MVLREINCIVQKATRGKDRARMHVGLFSAPDLHLSRYITEISHEGKDGRHTATLLTSWKIINSNPNSWVARPLRSMLAWVAQGPLKKFALPCWLPCQWANWVLLEPAVKSCLFGFLPLKSGAEILSNTENQLLARGVLGSTNMTVDPVR